MATLHGRAARGGVMHAHAAIIMLVALVGAYAPGSQAAAPQKSDQEALERLFADFSDAFNRHDAKAAAELCTTGVDYIVGDGRDFKGRTAVEEHLAPMFANRLSRMHRNANLRDVRFVTPDVAVLIGYYETTGAIGPDGSPSSNGVYDWVARKSGGHWQISLWHEATLHGRQPAGTPPSEFKPGDVVSVPLFFREDFKIPAVIHEGVFGQQNVSNPNLELTLYGPPESVNPARKPDDGMQVESGPDPGNFGHIFTGFCAGPCGMTLRDKDNFVDLSRLGKIRWLVKVSGLHQVHPVIKLADGMWLLGEHGDGVFADYHPYEFTLSDTRWIKIEMDKVITRGLWLDKVDLSKVDEVGFVDLIPGSGHHPGGWITMAGFEVYGNAVPRVAAPAARTEAH